MGVVDESPHLIQGFIEGEPLSRYAARAVVSLLVGGIGIMNIMLVSVTERTLEIGIRLAISALETEVFMQLLVESIVLSSFGGLIGIRLALTGSLWLANFLRVPFNTGIVVVAFVFSAAVGVIFGCFPALKAARMGPNRGAAP